jgi:hypothetical protein
MCARCCANWKIEQVFRPASTGFAGFMHNNAPKVSHLAIGAFCI